MHKKIVGEILISGLDFTSSKINTLKKSGTIRNILPTIYTSNFKDSDEEIILRNWIKIVAHKFPNAILSFRSAFDYGPKNGTLYITYNTKKVFNWPGLKIVVSKGELNLDSAYVLSNALYVASYERACLENLSSVKNDKSNDKTIGQEELERKLVQILKVKGESALNKLRDDARILANTLNFEKEFKKLNSIISALLSTHNEKTLKSTLGKAYASRLPYDEYRIELFEELVRGLKRCVFEERPSKTKEKQSFENFAFFESYFSNYIEGTTFLIEEAKQIIYQDIMIENRTSDSHDIKGTFAICGSGEEMTKIPMDAEELILFLQRRHAKVMQGRPDKNPGIFKDKPNRAGNTFFVEPNLVSGTLVKGFEMMSSLFEPIQRAIFMMFMISEVHPFNDGNGRIARIMMNAELQAKDTSSIIIPTVYRQDYILNLKKFSQKKVVTGFIKMMDNAHAFSHWLDPKDYESLHLQLKYSNAFEEQDATLKFDIKSRSEIN